MKPKHTDQKGQQKVRLGNTASFSRDLERKINSKLMGELRLQASKRRADGIKP
jgi:hypothetical protein